MRCMIPTKVRSIIDEINAIIAIGFNGIYCDIIIVTIVLDITHVVKSDFNDIVYYILLRIFYNVLHSCGVLWLYIVTFSIFYPWIY